MVKDRFEGFSLDALGLNSVSFCFVNRQDLSLSEENILLKYNLRNGCVVRSDFLNHTDRTVDKKANVNGFMIIQSKGVNVYFSIFLVRNEVESSDENLAYSIYYSVLLHEIGHIVDYLNNDGFCGRDMIDIEAEADKFVLEYLNGTGDPIDELVRDFYLDQIESYSKKSIFYSKVYNKVCSYIGVSKLSEWGV